MSIGAKQQAVQSAGDRLDSIEKWSRRTYYATVVGTCFLGIMASATLYAAFVYVRVVMAVNQASASFKEDMKAKFPMPPRKGGSPF